MINYAAVLSCVEYLICASSAACPTLALCVYENKSQTENVIKINAMELCLTLCHSTANLLKIEK